MKRRFIKADVITVVIAALLIVAAVWVLADTLVGAKSLLSDRLFSFALGLFIGNAIRLIPSRRTKPDPVID